MTNYLPTLLNLCRCAQKTHMHTHTQNCYLATYGAKGADTHTDTLAQNHTWNLVASCSTITPGPIKYIHSIHYNYYHNNTNYIFFTQIKQPKHKWMLERGENNLRVFSYYENLLAIKTLTWECRISGFQKFVYYTWTMLFYLHI